MSTQIHLNTTQLSLLSIRRDKYWLFAGAILQLLHHSINNEEFQEQDKEVDHCNKENSSDEDNDEDDDTYSTSSISSFGSGDNLKIDNTSKIHKIESVDSNESNNTILHISFTPCEITVICSKKLMQKYFSKAIETCKDLGYLDVELVDNEFLCLIVESDGSFDKSLRIVELTKPLSENNISLFFISSHYNDIVLFPSQFKDEVISILKVKQFNYSDLSQSFIRHEDFDHQDIINNDRMENETFELFKRFDIKPVINSNVKLLLTGSRSNEVKHSILKTIKILSTITQIPKYFSITRTSFNELSLLLPKSSKKRSLLGFDTKYIIGSVQDTIIPITIDLQKLPIDSTGIVASLASKLIKNGGNLIELSYFSTAKSGIIMIPQENIEIVRDILKNDENCCIFT